MFANPTQTWRQDGRHESDPVNQMLCTTYPPQQTLFLSPFSHEAEVKCCRGRMRAANSHPITLIARPGSASSVYCCVPIYNILLKVSSRNNGKGKTHVVVRCRYVAHHTSHFSVGFIYDPFLHLNCLANSLEFDKGPITLKCCHISLLSFANLRYAASILLLILLALNVNHKINTISLCTIGFIFYFYKEHQCYSSGK